MGANNKLDAIYHPQTWTCEWCGHTWGNPHSAARCCDEISMSLHAD